jgi:hypothetical protein
VHAALHAGGDHRVAVGHRLEDRDGAHQRPAAGSAVIEVLLIVVSLRCGRRVICRWVVAGLLAGLQHGQQVVEPLVALVPEPLVLTSPVTGALPRRITVVGPVLAPRGSEQALGPVLDGVGSVVYYRQAEGQDVRVLTGEVQVSGAMLANPAGQPEDVLLAAGVVVVTGPVTSLAYAQVVVTGQFVAPEASREVLEPRIEVQGQSAWYHSDNPRVIFEDTWVGQDFFRLLDGPVSLIVLGDLYIAPDVTEKMLQEKVTDIVLLADITAPAALVPVLQVLATDAHGAIRASDASGS